MDYNDVTSALPLATGLLAIILLVTELQNIYYILRLRHAFEQSYACSHAVLNLYFNIYSLKSQRRKYFCLVTGFRKRKEEVIHRERVGYNIIHNF